MEQLTLEKFISIEAPVKKCTRCKELKELTEFNKDKSRNDGYSYTCRACQKIHGHNNYHKNINDMRQKHKEYYELTKEIRSVKHKEYRDLHKKEKAEYYKNYMKNNKIKIMLKNKRLYETKKEHYLSVCRKYRKTEQGINTKKRHVSKRRNMGFNPINSYFKGSHYHHLMYDIDGNKDSDIGIYIPSKLHRSVFHNSFTGRGMEEINKLAIEWYLSTCNSNIEELLKLGFNSVEEFVERYKPKDCI